MQNENRPNCWQSGYMPNDFVADVARLQTEHVCKNENRPNCWQSGYMPNDFVADVARLQTEHVCKTRTVRIVGNPATCRTTL